MGLSDLLVTEETAKDMQMGLAGLASMWERNFKKKLNLRNSPIIKEENRAREYNFLIVDGYIH